jgi:ribosomal protein L4
MRTRRGRKLKASPLPPPGYRIIFRDMVFPRTSPLTRLRIKPDEPAEGSTVADPPAVQASDRPKGTRRPHPDSSVRAVRHVVETTTLTFAQIQARTGVNHSTITLWKRIMAGRARRSRRAIPMTCRSGGPAHGKRRPR